jgi:transcriptional regulator with XRE-family HTH domain
MPKKRAKREDLDALLRSVGKGPDEAAKLAGIGTATLWRWRNGLSRPRNRQLARLAEALGVAVERVSEAIAVTAKGSP